MQEKRVRLNASSFLHGHFVQHRAIYLGIEARALSEEGAGDEPEAVGHGELILDDV